MYRRPASDRNYEFWGDQTFFGENPPQAALISWYLKKQVGEVKLKIADALGQRGARDFRAGAGQQQQGRHSSRRAGTCGFSRWQRLPRRGSAAGAARCSG